MLIKLTDINTNETELLTIEELLDYLNDNDLVSSIYDTSFEIAED